MKAGALSVGLLPPGFEDWPELLSLIQCSFAYMDGIIDPPSSMYQLTQASLREKAIVETILVARAGLRLVGCVSLADRGDHLYLGKLAIHPDFQGKGLGRRLVEAAEAFARQAGKSAIELQTRVELTANHMAFARLGFVETARTAHPGYERPTSVTMRKRLG